MRQTWIRIASYLLASVGLALVAWQATVWMGHHNSAERRAAAVEVARNQVLDLTTLDAATVKSKLDAMGSRVTGGFKRQFDGFSTTFAQVVEQEKVVATGRIKSAGIASSTESSMVVLVASSAEISNSKQTNATRRDYRMSVSLDRIGDSWLISGMEFVP